MSTPFYLQAVQTSKHPGARAVKPTSEARTPLSSMAIDGKKMTTIVSQRLQPECKNYIIRSLYADEAWDKRFLRVERDFDRPDRRIAVRRSCVSRDFHDRSRLLTLPDDVRLPVAVGDDKSDVSVCRHTFKGFEAQRGLLNPAIVVVVGFSGAGGYTAKRNRRDVGEDSHRQVGESFEHHFTL